MEPSETESYVSETPKYPGIRITTNGNQLVAYYTEARLTDGGVFFPITPSTEMGELYQQYYAEGKLNVFGGSTLAIEAEGCLLYTSPSPRDGLRSRMPSSA